MLKIGTEIDGKYKVLNEIGHGGMSTVYLASDFSIILEGFISRYTIGIGRVWRYISTSQSCIAQFTTASSVYLAINEKANKPWAIKEVRKCCSSNYEVLLIAFINITEILSFSLRCLSSSINCFSCWFIICEFSILFATHQLSVDRWMLLYRACR